MKGFGGRRWKRPQVAAVLLAAALGIGSAPEASGRASMPPRAGAALCQSGYSSNWKITSESLKVVRQGTWTTGSGGPQASATETDTMSSARHLNPIFDNVLADEACSPWQLSLNLIRPFTQDLSGQWSEPTQSGSPLQGTCSKHREVRQTGLSDPFTLAFIPPTLHGANVFFKNSARRVKLVVDVSYGAGGLACQMPDFAATFDFPTVVGRLDNTVTSLPTRTIKRDRSFTLRFHGSAAHTETWLSPQTGGAKEHFDVTWTGAIHFQGTGCQEDFFATGKTLPKCSPG